MIYRKHRERRAGVHWLAALSIILIGRLSHMEVGGIEEHVEIRHGAEFQCFPPPFEITGALPDMYGAPGPPAAPSLALAPVDVLLHDLLDLLGSILQHSYLSQR